MVANDKVYLYIYVCIYVCTYMFVYKQHTCQIAPQCVITKWPTVGLTFNVEIHGLADVSSDIVADSTQVEAAVFLQHMFDEERAVDQHFDAKAWIERDGLELRDSSTCERAQHTAVYYSADTIITPYCCGHYSNYDWHLQRLLTAEREREWDKHKGCVW